MAFYQYLHDSDVHVVDCSGRVDLKIGLARLNALVREFGLRPIQGGQRKVLIDFRATVWESEEVHMQLSRITRRDLGFGPENTATRMAILNNQWSGSVSDNEHWFLTDSDALKWLCLR
jgi:hypothetical protein